MLFSFRLRFPFYKPIMKFFSINWNTIRHKTTRLVCVGFCFLFIFFFVVFFVMLFRVINKRRIWFKKINNVRINYVEHLEKFIAPIKLVGETDRASDCATQPMVAFNWSCVFICANCYSKRNQFGHGFTVSVVVSICFYFSSSSLALALQQYYLEANSTLFLVFCFFIVVVVVSYF